MQYTLTISQTKALEWGLNAQQALLFAFVYECPSWANPIKTADGIFYALSKAKIVEELPLLTERPDTAYRLLRQLEQAGVIGLSHTSSITLVRLTDKGREWNKAVDGSDKYAPNVGRKNIRPTSDKSPTTLGKISDVGSDKSPTNQDTSNQDTNQSTGASAQTGKFNPLNAQPENVSAEVWADWCTYRKEIRKPLTATSCKQQAKALADHHDADAVLLLSIGNGWTGIFPDRVTSNVHSITKSRFVNLPAVNADELRARADENKRLGVNHANF